MTTRQLLYNAGLAAWFAIDGFRCVRSAISTAGVEAWNGYLLGGVMLILAGIVLWRKPAVTTAMSWGTAVVVIASTAAPMCYELLPSIQQPYSYAVGAVRWFGTLVLLGSVLCLGTNFSVFPQRRTIVSHGPYNVVRHPIYTSYLLVDLTWWAPQGSVLGALVWVAEAVLFYQRARLEEACLSEDALYREYCRMVPYRLVPGVL